jgi:hypothetical protein
MRRLATFLLAAVALGAECVPVAMEPGTVEGTFAAAECKGQDFLPDASTRDIPGIRPMAAVAYEVSVPEGGGILRVQLTVPGVAPIAVLADEKLAVLQFVAGQIGTPGELRVSVKAGKHRILAAAGNVSAGAFTLLVELLERRACTTPDLTFDVVLNGQLDAEDCRLLDVQTPSSNLQPVDTYRIRVEAYSLYGIAAASNTFRPVLAMLNAKTGTLVHNGQDTNNGGQALLTLSLPEGEYLLVVISGGVAAGGTYVLRALTEPARTCTPELLEVPGSVRSALANSDCRLLDFVPFSGNFSFIRPYTIELAERSLLTLDQTSTQFDSYLNLLREDKSFLAEDDDSGGNGNSRIAILLRPGKYTVLANAYDEGAIGAFELRASVAAPRECPVEELPLTGTLNASLAADDCRVRDLIEEEPAGNPARAYRVTVENAGRLSAEMGSTAFDTGLALLDETGNALPMEFVRVRAGVIRGTAQVKPGTYTVIAYSLNRLGAFTLAGSFAP